MLEYKSDGLNAMEDMAIYAVRQQLWKVPITTHEVVSSHQQVDGYGLRMNISCEM